MTECRCEIDGGDYCFAKALHQAEASGDPSQVAFLEWLERSSVGSGVPFHVVDPVVLYKIAVLMVPAGGGQR